MLQLNAEPRAVFGKKVAKIRKEGKLPAVLYGAGKKESLPIFVNLGEFKKVWAEAEESAIIKLKGAAGSNISEDVMIYDVSMDTIKGEPLHVDFYVIDATKTMTAEVPIEFEGIAGAVKEHGGVLVKVLHEIEVEALPKDLPHEIKIDLAKLAKIGDKIMAGDIALPSGVKLITKADMIVILAKPHEEEKVEEQVRTIEDVEVSEKKGKKEEEGAEAAPEAKK
ncbi:MAG: 50S ribosomal protein L25 [Candidatus Pacebacteria bacterium]|nr:50S ribosomal protein L25 [Candidatus Paceibacterota bacterium]NUQ57313.1 50S ribosomal protein L25 [Candidatus Paceibacter sp.]